MEHEIIFFNYKKGCKEERILKKATGKSSTRKDLIEGKKLFDSITKNIAIIDSKQFTITRNILNNKVAILGSNYRDLIGQDEVEITDEYDILKKDFDSNFNDLSPELTLNAHIKKINSYLDPYFDHDDEIKKIKKMQKDNGPDSWRFRHEFGLRIFKLPISKSVEYVLNKYSKASNKLKQYYDLILKS